MGSGASRRNSFSAAEHNSSKQDESLGDSTFQNAIVPGLTARKDELLNGRDKSCERKQVLAKHEWALQFKKSRLGNDHLDVAQCLNEVGQVYDEMGQLAEAATAMEEALKILEKHHGREHMDVAVLLNRIGNIYETMDKVPQAMAMHEEALKIRMKLAAAREDGG